MNSSNIENEINEINKCISNLHKNINSIDIKISKNNKNEILLNEENNSDDNHKNDISKNIIKKHFDKKKILLEQHKNFISEQSSFSRALTNISRNGKKKDSISPDSLKEVSDIINKTNQNLLNKNIIGDEKDEFKINPYFRHSFHSSKSIPRKNNSVCFVQNINNNIFQDNLIIENENEISIIKDTNNDDNNNENNNEKNKDNNNDNNNNKEINKVISNIKDNNKDKNKDKIKDNNKDNIKDNMKNIQKKKGEYDKISSPLLIEQIKKNNKLIKNDKFKGKKKINSSPHKKNNISLSNFNSELSNRTSSKSKKNILKNKRNERGSFDLNKTMPFYCKSFKGNILKNKLKEGKKSIIVKQNIQNVKIENNDNNKNKITISPRKKKNKSLIFQEYKCVPTESLNNIFLIIKEINELNKQENKNNEKINLYSDLSKTDKNFKEMIISVNKINDLYKKCCINKHFLEIKNSFPNK